MMSIVKSIKVKIRNVVDPRTFWATETKKLSVNSLKIKSIEGRLEEQFTSDNGETISAISEIGSYVAVKYESRWRRGRLMSLFRERSLLASVFLIDYGITIDRVLTDTRVRVLDDSYLRDAPQAFQVVLKGLSPVTMDCDWSFSGEDKMTPCPSSSWDPAALRFVHSILENSKLEADLADIVIDNCGRRHGILKLYIDHGKVSLNSLLIERKFAAFNSEKFEEDLVSADQGDLFPYQLYLPAISELSEDSKPDEEEEDSHSLFISSKEESETLEQFVKEFPAPVVKQRGESFMFASIDVRKSNDRKHQSQGANRGRRFSMPAIRSSSSRNRDPPKFESLVPINKAEEPTSNVSSSQKFLEMLRRGSMTAAKALQEEKEEEDVIDWSTIKKDNPSMRRDPFSGDGDTLSYSLPGGVTIGKYHENVVCHILSGNSKSSKSDLKNRFEDFVSRTR